MFTLKKEQYEKMFFENIDIIVVEKLRVIVF